MNRSNLKKFLAPSSVILLLILATFIVYLPVIAGRKTFYTGLDNIDQFYTWYQNLAKSIASGYLPLWDNNALSGKSFAGELQPGVFYPINLIWVYIFGSSGSISRYALDILAVVHGFIAMSGMYLLARKINFSKVASCSAGMIYAFSGPVLARGIGQISIYYGLTWIPLGVAMIIGAFKSSRLKTALYYSIGSGMVAGLSVLSGHMQPFLHLSMVIVALWLYSVYSEKSYTRHLKIIVSFILGFIFVAGAQLYISNQWFSQSYRLLNDGYRLAGDKVPIGSFLRAFIVEPGDLQNYFIPGFIKETNTLYIGIVSWIFVVGFFVSRALIKKVKSNFKIKVISWEYRVIVIVGIIGLLVALGYHLFVASIFYFIPIVGSSIRQLSRYSILPHIALSVVVAHCIDYIIYNRKRIGDALPKNYKLVVISLFLGLQSVYFLLLPDNLVNIAFRTQVAIAYIISILLILLIKKRSRLIAFNILVLLSIMSSSLLNVQFYTKDFTVNSSPEHIYKSTKIIEYLESKYLDGYRTMILDGAAPQNIGYVYDISTVGGYGATIFKDYLDYIEHNKKDIGVSLDPYSELADIFGVKYVIAKKELNLNLLIKDNGVYLYQRKTAYSKIMRIADSGELEECNHKIITLADNYQKYIIEAPSTGDYVINDFYAKGWRAKVDDVSSLIESYGQDSEAKPFRKVKLNKGAAILEFMYEPFSML